MSRVSVRSCLSWTTSRVFDQNRLIRIQMGTSLQVCLSFSILHIFFFPQSSLLAWSFLSSCTREAVWRRSTSCLRPRNSATSQFQRYTTDRSRLLSVVSNIRYLAQRQSYISTSALNMRPCPPASVIRSFSGHIPLSLMPQNMGASIPDCSLRP